MTLVNCCCAHNLVSTPLQYQLFVNSIRDSVRNHVVNIEEGFSGMSKVISSDAKARGSQHPYYQLPNFEVVGGGVRKQSGVEVIAYSPILDTPDDVPAWIKYTSRTDHTWLAASVDAAVETGMNSRGEYDVGPFTPAVYNIAANGAIYAANGTGPFSPLWQVSPPPFRPSSINFNVNDFDFVRKGVAMLNQTRQAVFSRILEPEQVRNIQELVMSPEQHEQYHNELVINGRDHDAHSVYMVPVFADAFDTNSPLVGLLSSFFTWDRYVVNLLPEGVRGIICVIRNTCGQAVSYELVGNRVSSEKNLLLRNLPLSNIRFSRRGIWARATDTTSAMPNQKKLYRFLSVNKPSMTGTRKNANLTLFCTPVKTLSKVTDQTFQLSLRCVT